MSERLRRWVRTRLGYRSPLYRIGAEFLNQIMILFKAGPLVSVQLIALRASRKNTTRSVKFPNIRHPFVLRSNGQDVSAAVNNFVREEYGEFPATFSPHSIVDAGAYIGDTSAYFLSRFPEAQVVALEPTVESFSVAQQNLSDYGDRVTLLRVALGGGPGVGSVDGALMGAGLSGRGQKVEIIGVPDLLRLFPEGRIDLLKLDIEGAEVEVFRHAPSDWLGKVSQIVMETHGQQIENEVLEVLSLNGWSYRRYRNLWYCTPNA